MIRGGKTSHNQASSRRLLSSSDSATEPSASAWTLTASSLPVHSQARSKQPLQRAPGSSPTSTCWLPQKAPSTHSAASWPAGAAASPALRIW